MVGRVVKKYCSAVSGRVCFGGSEGDIRAIDLLDTMGNNGNLQNLLSLKRCVCT